MTQLIGAALLAPTVLLGTSQAQNTIIPSMRDISRTISDPFDNLLTKIKKILQHSFKIAYGLASTAAMATCAFSLLSRATLIEACTAATPLLTGATLAIMAFNSFGRPYAL